MCIIIQVIQCQDLVDGKDEEKKEEKKNNLEQSYWQSVHKA